MSCDIGVYGLSVMGSNLALNIASKGFNVAVSNRSPERVFMHLSISWVGGHLHKAR